ncbi:MAG: PH domain-containing protein [Candidatus Limnocylindrales bacterium]
MRYTDSLLADGEVIVRDARQHWLAPLVEGIGAWVLLLVGALALVAGLLLRQTADPGPTIGMALSVVALLALAGGLLLAIRRFLAWRAQHFMVTNRRVLQVEGILNKRAADSSLEKINDAILTQTLLGRILGYGDLEVLTASESAIDRFRMLAHAAAFKREMLNQKHALELELGRPSTPPLRADRAAASPAGSSILPDAPPGTHSGADAREDGAAPWAPPGAAASADPEQIMFTLGRLADLRDRGAITAEEFEAKKAELLARL